MKTQIIDIHKIHGQRPAFDVYIGRAVRYTEFTQNSIWYNPYYAKDYSLEHIQQCLLDYEIYIKGKINKDPKRYNLNNLVGKVLACWCVNTSEIEPLRCHGQILLKLIREAEMGSPPHARGDQCD